MSVASRDEVVSVDVSMTFVVRDLFDGGRGVECRVGDRLVFAHRVGDARPGEALDIGLAVLVAGLAAAVGPWVSGYDPGADGASAGVAAWAEPDGT